MLDDCACNPSQSDTVAVSLFREPLKIDASAFEDKPWTSNRDRLVGVDLEVHSQLPRLPGVAGFEPTDGWIKTRHRDQ